MMKISMNLSGTMQKFGPEKAIELYAKAGFDAYDFSFFSFIDHDWRTGGAIVLMPDSPLMGEEYVAYAKKLRALADSYGIVCNQTHAPFPISNLELRKTLPWALEVTAILGGKHCVIHPDNNRSAEENAEVYRELLPLAKSLGVKIATENMWNWTSGFDGKGKELDHALPAACSHHDDFLAHLTAVGDEYLIACLDIGHAEMYGLDTSAVEMIRTLGKHIEVLHVHDNDKWHDNHAEPFTMQVDFDAIVAALREIGYAGDMTLEVGLNFPTDDEEQALSMLRRLAATANRLREMFLQK